MPVPTLDKVQEDQDESETSMSGGHYGIDDPKSEASPIEKRENRLVCCSKMLVLLVIVTVAVGMGFITHSFVKSQQHADYVSHVSSCCLGSFFLSRHTAVSQVSLVIHKYSFVKQVPP